MSQESHGRDVVLLVLLGCITGGVTYLTVATFRDLGDHSALAYAMWGALYGWNVGVPLAWWTRTKRTLGQLSSSGRVPEPALRHIEAMRYAPLLLGLASLGMATQLVRALVR